ncbi:hypothetical protein WJX79_003873 [Trebouxia sp. C0005]
MLSDAAKMPVHDSVVRDADFGEIEGRTGRGSLVDASRCVQERVTWELGLTQGGRVFGWCIHVSIDVSTWGPAEPAVLRWPATLDTFSSTLSNRCAVSPLATLGRFSNHSPQQTGSVLTGAPVVLEA